jgi:hypothetical protein
VAACGRRKREKVASQGGKGAALLRPYNRKEIEKYELGVDQGDAEEDGGYAEPLEEGDAFFQEDGGESYGYGAV